LPRSTRSTSLPKPEFLHQIVYGTPNAQRENELSQKATDRARYISVRNTTGSGDTNRITAGVRDGPRIIDLDTRATVCGSGWHAGCNNRRSIAAEANGLLSGARGLVHEAFEGGIAGNVRVCWCQPKQAQSTNQQDST
jgi:hypothetical protein